MQREGRACVLLLALGATALFSGIGDRGLFETSEARYGSIAAEMARSGDWVVPRINGVVHFEKPPLASWAMAASLRLCGESEAALRIPGVLAALIALVCAYSLAGGRRTPRAPLGAAALTVASPLFFGVAQSATTDIYLAACSAAALLGAVRSLDPEQDSRARARALTWAAVASGLGFLVKGPVIWALTLLPILLEALWSRDFARLRALISPWRVLLFAAIALPWFLLASARTPGLLGWFLGQRAFGALVSSQEFHRGPVLYYVPVFLLGFLPGSGILLMLGRGKWSELVAERRQRLLLCACVCPFLLMSFSASKLVPYVLPVVVPASVLAATALERYRGRKGIVVAGAALALIATAAAVAGTLRGTFATVPASANWLFGAAGVAALLGAGGALFLALRGRARAGCAALVVLQLVALRLCVPALGLSERELNRSGPGREIARAVSALAADGRPILAYRCFVRSLPFYTGRHILLVDFYRPDVTYERDTTGVDLHGPGELQAQLAHGPAVILCRTRQVEELLRDAGPLRPVTEIGRYSILVNEPVTRAK